MKKLRLFAAIFVAISTLVLADPARAVSFTDWSTSSNVVKDADCVQFSYTWGSASKLYPVNSEMTGVQFNVNVQNDITNKIGGNGEVFDSYSLQMDIINGGVIVDTVLYEETRTKHVNQPRQIGIGYIGFVESVNVTLRGIDHGFWGGYYGPIMCAPNLVVLGAPSQPTPEPTVQPEPTATQSPEVPATPEPTQPEQTPAPTLEPTPSPSPIVGPENSVRGSADEGWDLTLSAPEGYKFTSVYFASYGVPDNYTTQWCHAEVSAQKVEEVFVGQTTGTIASNNGVFGDPCGGTYKRLQVVLVYERIVPEVVPAPEPTPVPEPSPTPLPEPTQSATSEPTPEPTTSPTIEPSPTTEPEPQPTVVPTLEPEPTLEPTSEPEPIPSQTPEPSPSELPSDNPSVVVEELLSVPVDELTTAQVEMLVAAAMETFQTAEQGSPEYQQALEALAVAAEADDPEVPEEIAAIPLVGNVAAAALEVFNNLGNVGADMSPQVRETAEKTVIASVIGVQAAVNAVGAATTVAAASNSSTRRP